MFDIGFPELMLVAIIALLVMGPERLPEAMRTVGLWWGRFTRSFNAIRAEIEREVGMDEVRRQVYNESILADLQKAKREVTEVQQEARAAWLEGTRAATGDSPSSNPSAVTSAAPAEVPSEPASTAPPAVLTDAPNDPTSARTRTEALNQQRAAGGEQQIP